MRYFNTNLNQTQLLLLNDLHTFLTMLTWRAKSISSLYPICSFSFCPACGFSDKFASRMLVKLQIVASWLRDYGSVILWRVLSWLHFLLVRLCFLTLIMLVLLQLLVMAFFMFEGPLALFICFRNRDLVLLLYQRFHWKLMLLRLIFCNEGFLFFSFMLEFLWLKVSLDTVLVEGS